ncbi:MAG: YbgA family protein [Halanaerobiaceae bacterium]
MKNYFHKPKLIVSKCLGFDHCRYDGQIISNEFIKELEKHANIIPICPAVEIGLEVPRSPIRLVKENNRNSLIQPATGKNITARMETFSLDFLRNKAVDGFILKNRSPSCAINDCKLYDKNNPNPIGKTSGHFARIAQEKFPDVLFEDEGRLTNFTIRDHFLTGIYTKAEFRKIKKEINMSDLVDFQSKYKYLLMAINEQEMRKLGRIVANTENESIEKIFNKYEKHLNSALNSIAKYTSNINVLMHAFGYFSNNLNKDEKSFFLDILEKYKDNKVPLSVPKNILKSWIIKYDEEYLAQQQFFTPYPEELIDIKDSGAGR